MNEQKNSFFCNGYKLKKSIKFDIPLDNLNLLRSFPPRNSSVESSIHRITNIKMIAGLYNLK